MDESTRKDWHLEKSVSLGHIMTTVVLLLTLAGGYTTISERIAVLENQQSAFNDRMIALIENQRRMDGRQDAEIQEIRQQIREDLKSINSKLDTMIMER